MATNRTIKVEVDISKVAHVVAKLYAYRVLSGDLTMYTAAKQLSQVCNIKYEAARSRIRRARKTIFNNSHAAFRKCVLETQGEPK